MIFRPIYTPPCQHHHVRIFFTKLGTMVPRVGEFLLTQREPQNPVDRYAVAVKRSGEIVSFS